MQDCDVSFACGVCRLPPRLRLTMKGLCNEDSTKEEKYDREYYIYGQKNGKPYFR